MNKLTMTNENTNQNWKYLPVIESFSLWNRMQYRKSMIACKIFTKETFLLMQRSNTESQQVMS